MFISGPAVAKGYANDSTRTAQSFSKAYFDPILGCIYGTGDTNLGSTAVSCMVFGAERVASAFARGRQRMTADPVGKINMADLPLPQIADTKSTGASLAATGPLTREVTDIFQEV